GRPMFSLRRESPSQHDFSAISRPSVWSKIYEQRRLAAQVLVICDAEIFVIAVYVLPQPGCSAADNPLSIGDVHVPVDRLEAGSIEYLRADRRDPRTAKK